MAATNSLSMADTNSDMRSPDSRLSGPSPSPSQPRDTTDCVDPEEALVTRQPEVYATPVSIATFIGDGGDTPVSHGQEQHGSARQTISNTFRDRETAQSSDYTRLEAETPNQSKLRALSEKMNKIQTKVYEHRKVRNVVFTT